MTILNGDTSMLPNPNEEGYIIFLKAKSLSISDDPRSAAYILATIDEVVIKSFSLPNEHLLSSPYGAVAFIKSGNPLEMIKCLKNVYNSLKIKCIPISVAVTFGHIVSVPSVKIWNYVSQAINLAARIVTYASQIDKPILFDDEVKNKIIEADNRQKNRFDDSITGEMKNTKFRVSSEIPGTLYLIVVSAGLS
jgi:hypothetical protein